MWMEVLALRAMECYSSKQQIEPYSLFRTGTLVAIVRLFPLLIAQTGPIRSLTRTLAQALTAQVILRSPQLRVDAADRLGAVGETLAIKGMRWAGMPPIRRLRGSCTIWIHIRRLSSGVFP